MSTNPLSIPTPFFLSNSERRELARDEMQPYADSGLFRYLLHTPYIRHVIQPDGLMLHSTVDSVNILWDIKRKNAATDFDPRIQWQNTKRLLKRDDPQLYSTTIQLKLPSWTDGKLYQTDMISTGWFFFLLVGIRSELSNRIRAAFAEELNRYDREHHVAIIMELERHTGWAGTRNRLIMAGHHDPEDFENPRQPVGNPPEAPTLWKPRKDGSE